MPEKEPPADSQQRRQKVLTVVGIVLCVLMVPILIVNCTLLIKGAVNRQEVPDFAGLMPLIVLTDSMSPDINSGDLILCRTVDAAEVQVGDVISFYDPAGNGTSVVTHKVVRLERSGDTLRFYTQGVNNNIEDRLPVEADRVIATYTGVRIPGAGNVAIFMQTPTGLLVCVLLPVLLLVGCDYLRRRKYEKAKGDDMAALMAELETLRARAAETDSPDSDE